jgi:hypothetical protein
MVLVELNPKMAKVNVNIKCMVQRNHGVQKVSIELEVQKRTELDIAN